MQYESIHTEQARKHDLLPGVLQGLEASLQGKDFLTGQFSAGDVAVGSCLIWSKAMLGDKVCLLL